METAYPAFKRICRPALACVAYLSLGLTTVSSGQDRPGLPEKIGQQAPGADKGFTIRIGVEEVRLDAVVLDKNGRQITDLTADDFEIQQDYFRQKITSCIYINDYQPRLQKTVVRSKDSPELPPIPAPELTRENVRRTIVFLVDNLAMDFTQVHRARRALRKFVDEQMQKGDLVAIVPTAGGNAAFQTFSSDKRRLLSTIDNVRWFIDMRTTQITPQMMAMAYSIRTLQDMPGRKALIIVSPATMIPAPVVTKIGVEFGRDKRTAQYTEASFNPLADVALRAGVVIHTLDIRGLDVGYGIDAEQGFDYSLLGTDGNLNPQAIQDKVMDEVANRDSQTRIPLSRKTGGLFITDFNWFTDGIGPVQEELKGYYMLTYIPPPGTFRPESRNIYHAIQVKVKRPGSEVHARDGFYGVPEPAEAPAGISNTLYTAIFSPFQYNDLKIHLASGYIDDRQKGYLLRSSMYLEGGNLSPTQGKEGNRTITVEAASVTSDVNNAVKDSSAKRYRFDIKEADLPWVREHGIKFSMALPVKKPGAYYVRTAVRDPVSGNMGSAYQYIEIPDLKRNRLALSNIFIVNRSEDLPWIAAGAPEEFRTQLYPDVRRDLRRSPALRNYQPGDYFECAAIIYNAKFRNEQKPDLESQFVLYANGKELSRGNLEPVSLGEVRDYKRIPVRIKLRLANPLPAGDYVLLLQVKDKLAKKERSIAAQTLDFKVGEKQSAGGNY